MDGPPAWGLGELLTTPHRKSVLLRNIHTESLGPYPVVDGRIILR